MVDALCCLTEAFHRFSAIDTLHLHICIHQININAVEISIPKILNDEFIVFFASSIGGTI